MKKFLSLFGLLSFMSVVVYADTSSTLDLARKYEGNFYKYHCSGDWCPISEAGVVLGDAEKLESYVNISYYVNTDEDYVIQFYNDESNMSYAIWEKDNLSTITSSKY